MNYVSRAEKAIRTGQPNLAMLYMRRGLSETPEGRVILRRHDFREQIRKMARDNGMTIVTYIPGSKYQDQVFR